mgnify:CR=1 FL=1
MKNLIEKIKENSNLTIKNRNYQVKTKTWYSLEEDNEASYIKCELSNDKVLVIIPDDNLVYIGCVIENMNYVKSYKLAEFGEGDAGVTIAEFKK